MRFQALELQMRNHILLLDDALHIVNTQKMVLFNTWLHLKMCISAEGK